MKSYLGGFTIIEVILVIFFMAILGSIFGPALIESTQKQSVSTTTWVVAVNVERARSRGLMGMKFPGATFTVGSLGYQIGGENYFMDNGFVSNLSTATEFSGVGTTPEPLKITLNAPGGQKGIIYVATQGRITWETNP